MNKVTWKTADLYCGAGGFSEGLRRAADARGIEIEHVAVNHWNRAIETHALNFPEAVHFEEDIEILDPRKAVPGGYLDLLLASPSCTFHSLARGGGPVNEQSRSTAMHILQWCEKLYVERIIVENVREFQSWSPIYPCTCGAGNSTTQGHPKGSKCLTPIPELKGKLFRQWVSMLKALDYSVEFKILCSADFGGATTRQRLFIQAQRIHKPDGKRRHQIFWPEPTHIRPGFDKLGFYPDARAWRGAKEIIDWSLAGKSIYERKKPLSPNTMRRIYAGLAKYSGLKFLVGAGGPLGQGEPQSVDDPLSTILSTNHRAVIEPFVVVLRNNMDAQPIDLPLPALTAGGNHYAVAESYLVNMKGESNAADIKLPAPAITAHARHIGICESFILPHQHGADGDTNVKSVCDPLPTVTGTSSDIFVAEPMIIPQFGESQAKPVSDPLGAITTTSRGVGMTEVSFVLGQQTCSALRPDHEPLPTVASAGAISHITPSIVPITHAGGEDRVYDIERPLPTVTTANRGELALAEPFIVPFYGENGDQTPRTAAVADPLDTVTTQRTPCLASPYLVQFHSETREGEVRATSIENPLPTQHCSNNSGLATPFLAVFYGQGDDQSVGDPLRTITSRDRFALVSPEIVRQKMLPDGYTIIGYLDIKFRMLQPHELAAAMGFDKDYKIMGNREEQVKQIGNAVSVEVSEALCGCVMDKAVVQRKGAAA